jgi:uncharacterized C2H2 Zn-finger protein
MVGKQVFDLHMERHEFKKGELCARVMDCGSDEIFTAITVWQAHLRSKHSDGNMPERVCPIEGCDQVFDHHRNYNDHIRRSHNFRGERYLALKLVDKRGRTAAEQKEFEDPCGADTDA